MVTISPLATWLTSCPRTASTSSRFMLLKRPVLTATRALLRLIPVAKAFGEGESNMATSGIPIPASFACLLTTFNNQFSVSFCGLPITLALVMAFADHLDMAREIKAPPKPITAANMRSAVVSNPTPCSSRILSTPKILIIKLSNKITAKLVRINRNTLLILTTSPFQVSSDSQLIIANKIHQWHPPVSTK